MSNYLKSSNPFEDEEDDFTIVNKPATREPENPEYERRRQIWEEAHASEDRQLDSTRRALSSIYDSESVGIATAEELIRQGEILDNVETKTGDITANLKTSQKHLNSIKSVFGGFKNWWNGTSDTSREPVNSERKLQKTVDTGIEASASKPSAPKVKSSDVSGFYSDDNDLDSKFLAGSKPNYNNERMIHPVTNSSREIEIDDNLGMMSAGMARLKNLASGLGNEIDSQNDQLDRINKKVDVADHIIGGQVKQMRKIHK